MKISRIELIKYLNKKINNIALDKNKQLDVVERLYSQYGVPKDKGCDIIMIGVDLATYDDSILFFLASIFDETKVDNYFFENEIKKYKKIFFSEKPIFPIKFKCIKVREDQYIGAADSNFFALLGKEDLVKYELETQRPATIKRVKGEFERLVITLKEAAVKSILKLMIGEDYIPTTITLNIPIDDVDCLADYYYDNEENTLVINKLSYFNIIDGYHRWVSMFRGRSMKDDFCQEMELRIVMFSKQKAKQFIWQENNKTKITNHSAKSLDQNRNANIVVERLNIDNLFLLKGQIGIGKKIENADLSEVIDSFYFKNKRKEYNSIELVKIQKEVREIINAVYSSCENNMNRKYGFCALTIIFYVLKESGITNESINTVNEIIQSRESEIEKRSKNVKRVAAILNAMKNSELEG